MLPRRCLPPVTSLSSRRSSLHVCANPKSEARLGVGNGKAVHNRLPSGPGQHQHQRPTGAVHCRAAETEAEAERKAPPSPPSPPSPISPEGNDSQGSPHESAAPSPQPPRQGPKGMGPTHTPLPLQAKDIAEVELERKREREREGPECTGPSDSPLSPPLPNSKSPETATDPAPPSPQGGAKPPLPRPPNRGKGKGDKQPMPLDGFLGNKGASFTTEKKSGVQLMAGYLAFSGLTGTLAVGAALLAKFDLFSLFHWEDTTQLQFALAAILPLQVMNALIMGPSYSTWTLPKLTAPNPDPVAGEGSQGNKALQATSGVAEGSQDAGNTNTSSSNSNTSSTSSSNTSSITSSNSSAGGEAAVARGELTTTQLDSSSSTSSGSSGSEGVKEEEGSVLPSGIPASAWGKKPTPVPFTKTVKSALHIAQGHYVANNPTGDVNFGLECVAASVSSLASELLYRGVAISLLARWMRDRFYEAGAEDLVDVAGISLSTSDAALWSAGALVSLAVSALVVKRAVRPTRRTAVAVLDLRKGSKSPVLRPLEDPTTPTRNKRQPPPSPSSASATAPGFPSLLPETSKSLLATMSAATFIQGSRNLTQTFLLNFIFVATGGNLAASYSANLINQILFSLMQRTAKKRMDKRTASLAAELAEFSKILRKSSAMKAAATSSTSTSPTSSPTTTSSTTTSSIPSPDAASLSSSSTSTVPTPTTTASASSAASSDDLAPSTTAASSDDLTPTTAAASNTLEAVPLDDSLAGSSGPKETLDPIAANTRMGRALSSLDLLVPETKAAK